MNGEEAGNRADREMCGENDEEAGAEIIVESRGDHLVDLIMLIECLVLRDITKDGGANAGIQETVVADQVGGQDPNAKSFVAQAMQNVGGQEDADGRIGDDGDPTGRHGPKDERKAHESSNDSRCHEWIALLKRTVSSIKTMERDLGPCHIDEIPQSTPTPTPSRRDPFAQSLFSRDLRATSVSSRNKNSIPVFRKVSMASRGVLTMGWPLTLKLVFKTISRPVVLPTASRSAWNSLLSEAETV